MLHIKRWKNTYNEQHIDQKKIDITLLLTKVNLNAKIARDRAYHVNKRLNSSER